MKKLNQFFPYYGSKWRAAKKYPAPRYDTIIEPFAGGAGYSAFYHERNIILYDLNPDIADLWNFLINSTEEQILKIPLIKLGDKLSEMDLERGPKLLIGFWCARASATPRNHLSSWSEKWSDRFWCAKTREKIASQVQYIKHWKSICDTYENIENTIATYFIDPPYVKGGKLYPKKNINYNYLSKWAQTRNGQVIVCEQEQASWLPFKEFYDHKGIKNKKRTELLWTK